MGAGKVVEARGKEMGYAENKGAWARMKRRNALRKDWRLLIPDG